MVAIRSKRPVELLLHLTSRCTATGPLRPSWMITDYRLSFIKRNISADEMYLAIIYVKNEWEGDFGLGVT